MAPVLTVEPTPQTTSLQSIVCSYQAGWVPLTDDEDEVQLPRSMLPLYLHIASEYALGVLEREGKSVDVRMAEVQQGSLWAGAVRADASMQPTVGRLRNGVGSTRGPHAELIWDRSWADVEFL